MSFQATNFVLGLTDLTPGQKVVAFVLACHADSVGGNVFPSMDRIALEAGFGCIRSAQRYVRQLEKKKVVYAMTPKTGGRGHDHATVYRLDLGYKSPVNSDTSVTLSENKQRQVRRKRATSETVKGDTRVAKGRHQSHTNSNEYSVRVSEEDDQHQSRVEVPHPILNSKAHARDEEDKQSANNVPLANHPVTVSKVMSAAPDVAKLQAEILRIPLSGGRTFQINTKLQAIVRNELANGRPAALILEAAERIGGTLTDRDRMPGLTLADNLAAMIVAIEMEQVEAVEQQKRKERARMAEKLEKRRYELTKAILIEQEEEVGREYKAWQREHPDAGAEGFLPDEFHPSVFDRYQLVERLKYAGRDIFKEKRLCDLRREAEESPTILASVEAQLSAEGYGTTLVTQ